MAQFGKASPLPKPTLCDSQAGFPTPVPVRLAIGSKPSRSLWPPLSQKTNPYCVATEIPNPLVESASAAQFPSRLLPPRRSRQDCFYCHANEILSTEPNPRPHSSKCATAAHCGFLKTLPVGHHDRSQRAQTRVRLPENPTPPHRTRRKMFHPGCSRRRCSARTHSTYHQRG